MCSSWRTFLFLAFAPGATHVFLSVPVLPSPGSPPYPALTHLAQELTNEENLTRLFEDNYRMEIAEVLLLLLLVVVDVLVVVLLGTAAAANSGLLCQSAGVGGVVAAHDTDSEDVFNR